MLKPQVYQIIWEDGREETVTVDGRDYMFYERESGENSLELITGGNTMTAWFISAAAAMRRQGRFEGTPDDFFAQVAYVLPVRGGSQDADPTTPPEGSES